MNERVACSNGRPKVLQARTRANACTPEGEPISGTGGEKKTGLCTFVLYAIYLTSGNSILQRCSPVMVAFRFQPWPQTFVSTKNLDLIVPGKWPPSQGSVSDRWIPRKNSSHSAMFR